MTRYDVQNIDGPPPTQCMIDQRGIKASRMGERIVLLVVVQHKNDCAVPDTFFEYHLASPLWYVLIVLCRSNTCSIEKADAGRGGMINARCTGRLSCQR